MNYIKRFQNAQAFSVSVRNSYYQYQFMHIFLNNFHEGEKYTTQIAINQAQLNREGGFTDQKSLSITYQQTGYLNLDRSSGSGRNNERANIFHTKFNFCGGTNHYADFFLKIRKDKEKVRAAGDFDRQRTERTFRKCFKYRFVDHLIDKCQKPHKERNNERANTAHTI